MNEVFILGAGLSKAINTNMPLLNDLSNDINTWFTNNKYRVKFYYDIYEQYIKSSGITNFEDILTFLYQDFPWKTDEEKHILSALFIFISNLLREILLRKQSNILNNEDVLIKFLNYLHYNNSKLITFNYDTLLENLGIKYLKKHTIQLKRGEGNYNFNNIYNEIKIINILEDRDKNFTSQSNPININLKKDAIEIYFNNYKIPMGLFMNQYFNENYHHNVEQTKELLNLFKSKYYDVILKSPLSMNDFYQLPIERLASRGASLLTGALFDKSFRLFKLHGSINWYYSNPEFGSYGQLYLKEDSKSLNNLQNIYEKDLITLIIPPVFDKTNFLRIYSLKMLWQEAQNHLNNADKIYIIGYSLPESDLSVRLMLKKNTKDSAEIFIINNSDDVIERYKKLFYSNDIIIPNKINKLDENRLEINSYYYDYKLKRRERKTKKIILNFKYVNKKNDNILYDFIQNQLM